MTFMALSLGQQNDCGLCINPITNEYKLRVILISTCTRFTPKLKAMVVENFFIITW